MTEIVIVPTGTANIASVIAAFERLGAVPVIAAAADQIEQASHVMLPGVGAFGAAMERLQAAGLAAALAARLRADRPTICICVGHQLLFEASSESPGVAGFGLVAARIERFPAGVRTPQFGWNEVGASEDALLLERGWAYFANSFRATEAPDWRVAWGEHGGRFVAAMERGRIIGCQFHPELSHDYGAALLSRFLELA